MFRWTVAAIFGILVLSFGIGWAVRGNDFFMNKFFSPKDEQVRRETFEQSKAYNEGMSQELDKMYQDYIKGTPEQKLALKSIILHRVANYDTDKLPVYLQQFIAELRQK